MEELEKKWVSSARFTVPKHEPLLKCTGPYIFKRTGLFYSVSWWLIAVAFHGVWGELPLGLCQSDGSAWASCTHKTVEKLFIVAVPRGLYRKSEEAHRSNMKGWDLKAIHLSTGLFPAYSYYVSLMKGKTFRLYVNAPCWWEKNVFWPMILHGALHWNSILPLLEFVPSRKS